jgi:hypothetical protein
VPGREQAEAFSRSEPFRKAGLFKSVKITRMRRGQWNPAVAPKRRKGLSSFRATSTQRSGSIADPARSLTSDMWVPGNPRCTACLGACGPAQMCGEHPPGPDPLHERRAVVDAVRSPRRASLAVRWARRGRDARRQECNTTLAKLSPVWSP